MASSPVPESRESSGSQRPESPEQAARTAVEAERRPVPSRAGYTAKPGRLPVTEFAFNRAGAASPFGDDLRFPLPLDRLTYTHPSESTVPSLH